MSAAALVLLGCSSAAAFQAALAPVRGAAAVVRMTAADGMEGKSQETGMAVWDPLGLADLGSPATLAFFRHAELKHGRVAMAAFCGW